MAIAYQTSSAVTENNGWSAATSSTKALDAGTGSNRILIVGVASDKTTDYVSGITYNGTALTRVTGVLGSDSRYKSIWYLIAPSTGSNNVVVSFSGSTRFEWCGAVYTGAKQSGQVDAYVTSSGGTGANYTLAITTVADNCWLVCFNSDNYTTPPPTQRIRGSTLGCAIEDSNGAITPAGATSMVWNGGDQRNWANNLISIAPAVASGPANLKSLNTNLKANIKSYNTNLLANIKSINTNI